MFKLFFCTAALLCASAHAQQAQEAAKIDSCDDFSAKVYATYAEQARDAEAAYDCHVMIERQQFAALLARMAAGLADALQACDAQCSTEVLDLIDDGKWPDGSDIHFLPQADTARLFTSN